MTESYPLWLDVLCVLAIAGSTLLFDWFVSDSRKLPQVFKEAWSEARTLRQRVTVLSLSGLVLLGATLSGLWAAGIPRALYRGDIEVIVPLAAVGIGAVLLRLLYQRNKRLPPK